MRHSVNVLAGATSRPHIKCAAPCIQSTSVAAPLHDPGRSFPPGTQAPITMQGLAFSPIPSAPIVFSGAPGPMQSAGVPLPSAAKPPMAGAPWPSQATPLPSAFMAPASWPMYMPSYMPRLPAQQACM